MDRTATSLVILPISMVHLHLSLPLGVTSSEFREAVIVLRELQDDLLPECISTVCLVVMKQHGVFREACSIARMTLKVTRARDHVVR